MLEIINTESRKFLDSLFQELERVNIDVSDLYLDHICYRTSNVDEYESLKIKFSLIGKLLIESNVGGRPIATYKLNSAIIYNERKIEVIELPSPKKYRNFSTGFEHVEFVIKDSFDEFRNKNSEVDFDLTAINKPNHAELKLFLNNCNVKFHHKSLEKIIKEELSAL